MRVYRFTLTRVLRARPSEVPDLIIRKLNIDGRCASSPNQVLTHAARAAAKQLIKQLNKPFQAPLVAARGAREGLWSE